MPKKSSDSILAIGKMKSQLTIHTEKDSSLESDKKTPIRFTATAAPAALEKITDEIEREKKL